MSVQLLTTKLHIPFPGKYLVERSRLMEKVNECLHPGCRLAIISAPAGFGKTTLAATWADKAKRIDSTLSLSWLSLDEGDNDPVLFWTYLVTALQTQQENVGKQTLRLLTSAMPDLQPKLAGLLNDLVQIHGPFVLVLDDFHLIRNAEIQQSLVFFLDHIPSQFHLVILSRTDPPLPLALLRGRGQLLELRLKDLRFSNEDADRYLNTGLGLNLGVPSVEVLNQKTEGWIAGLQMAALSIRDVAASQNQEKIKDFVASFSGSDRFILDYLMEEVLGRQPEPIQEFLVRTSILDQLCSPLCDALLDKKLNTQLDTQSILEYLENSNLFITPLDNQRYWYRYHQLFSDLLRKHLAQMATESVSDLHRRAMYWYEQNGLIPRAIEHAFQIHDFPKAASLIGQIAEATWGRGEHMTLLRWIDVLPDEEIRQYPHFWVFKVSMLISAGRIPEAERCIPAIEDHIRASLASNSTDTSFIGKVSVLQTYIASFHHDHPALYHHAQFALENLTREEDARQRCGLLTVLSNAYLVDGDLEAAGHALMDSIENGKRSGTFYLAFTALANLVIVLGLQGRLKQAAQVCQEGLLIVQENDLHHSPMAAQLAISWGGILCEHHSLEQAEEYIDHGLNLAFEHNFIWATAWGYVMQARLRFAQGDLIAAEKAIKVVEELARVHEIPAHFVSQAVALQARIWIAKGNLEQAKQYLNAHGIQTKGEVQFPHESEYLMLSRLAWMRGDLELAENILKRILLWSELNKQTRAMISCFLLEALLNQSCGNHEHSMHSLEQAFALAEPESYFQMFMDEDEPMIDLLKEAISENIYPEYSTRLLGTLLDLQRARTANIKPVMELARRMDTSLRKDPLIEPLTKREMEILRLMSEGHSNKEIAQKLYVSLRTVKYYSTGLYQKLGVKGRMQAVIRARELNLL